MIIGRFRFPRRLRFWTRDNTSPVLCGVMHSDWSSEVASKPENWAFEDGLNRVVVTSRLDIHIRAEVYLNLSNNVSPGSLLICETQLWLYPSHRIIIFYLVKNLIGGLVTCQYSLSPPKTHRKPVPGYCQYTSGMNNVCWLTLSGLFLLLIFSSQMWY